MKLNKSKVRKGDWVGEVNELEGNVDGYGVINVEGRKCVYKEGGYWSLEWLGKV